MASKRKRLEEEDEEMKQQAKRIKLKLNLPNEMWNYLSCFLNFKYVFCTIRRVCKAFDAMVWQSNSLWMHPMFKIPYKDEDSMFHLLKMIPRAKDKIRHLWFERDGSIVRIAIPMLVTCLNQQLTSLKIDDPTPEICELVFANANSLECLSLGSTAKSFATVFPQCKKYLNVTFPRLKSLSLIKSVQEELLFLLSRAPTLERLKLESFTTAIAGYRDFLQIVAKHSHVKQLFLYSVDNTTTYRALIEAFGAQLEELHLFFSAEYTWNRKPTFNLPKLKILEMDSLEGEYDIFDAPNVTKLIFDPLSEDQAEELQQYSNIKHLELRLTFDTQVL